MGNAAGVGGVIAALFKPGLVVPHIVAPDINSLDWQALHRRGVSHVIFDKDNCVTLPLAPNVLEELRPGWQECIQTFGRDNILIVSNSAGSSDDPLSIEAEQLARTLGTNVLAHPHKKPSSRCAKQVVDLFTSPPISSDGNSPGIGHILVIGDRITTDILLASRIDRYLRKRSNGNQRAIGVLTTRVLGRERVGTRIMRWTEMSVLIRLQRLGVVPGGGWRTRASALEATELADWASCMEREQPTLNLYTNLEPGLAAATPATAALTYRARIWIVFEKGLHWLGQGWNLLMDGMALGTKSLSFLAPDRPHRGTTSDFASPWSPSSSSSVSTSTPLLRRRLLQQTSSRASQAAQKRLYSTRPPRRRPQASTQPPPSQAAAGKKSNWPAAIAALTLMPICWLGGVYLHDSLNGAPSLDGDQASQIPAASLKEEPEQRSSEPSPPPINPAAATNIIGPKQNISLLTQRLHLQRELASVEAKLDQQQQRLRTDSPPHQ